MKAFRKQIRMGKFAMPLWSLALAGAAVVAAAGQAVGPVLSGSVSGTAGLTVEQSVLLSTNASDHSITGHVGDDSLIVVNDEGTSFTAAIELHVGDFPVINLDLRNVSDADANAILELAAPAGVDIEVDEASGNLGEAQVSSNAWLLFVDKDNTDSLSITVSPKDDLKPGFYTISGRVVQVTG
ncbi:MAG: hypothetical protein HY681_04650 [Chloroflexi bacterium]|nr:hypothetical protein [Chloroflexota bacterium]